MANVESAVKDLVFVELDWLEEFQGDMKTLSKENYKRLKNRILDLKFSSPMHVWKDGDHYYILDGHQRYRTLKQMRDKEGHHIPKIPVVLVEATSKEQAKKKVLSLASQFGDLNLEGLEEQAYMAGLTLEEMERDYRMVGKEIEEAIQQTMEAMQPKDPSPFDDDGQKKYILEIEFPDEQAMKDEYEKLAASGLIVRFK